MLQVQARKLGNIVILSLNGQIVNGETQVLRDLVNTLEHSTALILNMTYVTTVDAHGLGVMLDLREQSERNGTRFVLMNVSRSLSRILEITRLDTVFQISSKIRTFPTVPALNARWYMRSSLVRNRNKGRHLAVLDL